MLRVLPATPQLLQKPPNTRVAIVAAAWCSIFFFFCPSLLSVKAAFLWFTPSADTYLRGSSFTAEMLASNAWDSPEPASAPFFFWKYSGESAEGAALMS